MRWLTNTAARSAAETQTTGVCRPAASVRSRCGFTLIEMTLAITLAAVFGVIVAPLLFRIAQQRHNMLQEQFALTEVSNLIDELSACAAGTLESRMAQLQSQGIADPQRVLPGAELSITLTQLEAGPAGRQFTCRLQWSDRAGNRVRPLMITGWNYAAAGGQP